MVVGSRFPYQGNGKLVDKAFVRQNWSGNLLPRRATEQAGSVMLLAAGTIMALSGFLALALDTGWLYHQRRRIQTAADAGAIYGGQEIRRGKKTTNQVEAGVFQGTADNGFTQGADGVEVTVEYPPASGPYAGNDLAVVVTVCQPQGTFFMPLLDVWSADVCARASAGFLGKAEGCIYALNPTEEKALYVHSDSNLEAECGLVISSTDPGGFYVASLACVEATSIGVTADNYFSDNDCNDYPSQVQPTPVTQTPPEPDPLAYLSPPSEVGDQCWQTDFNLDDPSKLPLLLPSKKWCKGLKIDCPVSVCGVIDLPAGNYVIAGKRLEIVGSDTEVTGTGVMFYATDWPGQASAEGILIGSGSTVTFTAPTSGPYEAILMYVDRTLPFKTANITVSSGATATFSGAIYAFNQGVEFHSGVSATSLSGAGVAIVADTVEVTSGTDAFIPADFSAFSGGSPIKRVTLLE